MIDWWPYSEGMGWNQLSGPLLQSSGGKNSFASCSSFAGNLHLLKHKISMFMRKSAGNE